MRSWKFMVMYCLRFCSISIFLWKTTPRSKGREANSKTSSQVLGNGNWSRSKRSNRMRGTKKSPSYLVDFWNASSEQCWVDWKPWLVVWYRGWNPTQLLYGDYFISQYKDPVLNQPGRLMECRSTRVFNHHCSSFGPMTGLPCIYLNVQYLLKIPSKCRQIHSAPLH